MKHRNWALTINYQSESPPDNHSLKDTISSKFSHINYFVFSLEKGNSGTYHHHILICLKYATTFESIKKKFPRAHIQVPKVPLDKVDAYIRKDSTPENPAVSYGTLPAKGKRTDMEIIYDLLVKGASLREIRALYPSQYIRYGNHLKSVKQELIGESVEELWTNRTTTYIYGDTGLGKTRHVMEKYGYKNCYRVTDYKHPFDSYEGEPIIIFEEFRSSLKLADMLVYLDGYPVTLPARYHNKIALYKKIYILTNIPLFEQYKTILRNHPESYSPFLRRIDKVQFFCPLVEDGSTGILEFDDPFDALRFSFILYQFEEGKKPSGGWRDDWYFEGHYISNIVDHIKEVGEKYDLFSYSFKAPEYEDKNLYMKTIANRLEVTNLHLGAIGKVLEPDDSERMKEIDEWFENMINPHTSEESQLKYAKEEDLDDIDFDDFLSKHLIKGDEEQ